MNKLSTQKYQKLITILKENSDLLTTSIEEQAVDIIESIYFKAKREKSDISKAKINLINTLHVPEIDVTLKDN